MLGFLVWILCIAIVENLFLGFIHRVGAVILGGILGGDVKIEAIIRDCNCD